MTGGEILQGSRNPPDEIPEACVPATQQDDAGHRRDEAADERDNAAEQRDGAAALRDEAGSDRDHLAEERDHAGELRDRAARHREVAADSRDAAADSERLADADDRAAVASEGALQEGAMSRILERSWRAAALSSLARRDAASDRLLATHDRLAAAAERTQAGDDRDAARAQRGSGAAERVRAKSDRDSAHTDRNSASADRGSSASDLAVALLDGLTGVHSRAAGLLALQREVERSRRTGQPLVLAFVDVDGLKKINDSGGHAAGDRVLVRVARALTAGLRPYDLVVRYGGDEFLCVIADGSPLGVADRMQVVNEALADGPVPSRISVGVAGLRTDDTLETLIGRADDDLYRRRRRI